MIVCAKMICRHFCTHYHKMALPLTELLVACQTGDVKILDAYREFDVFTGKHFDLAILNNQKDVLKLLVDLPRITKYVNAKQTLLICESTNILSDQDQAEMLTILHPILAKNNRSYDFKEAPFPLAKSGRIQALTVLLEIYEYRYVEQLEKCRAIAHANERFSTFAYLSDTLEHMEEEIGSDDDWISEDGDDWISEDDEWLPSESEDE